MKIHCINTVWGDEFVRVFLNYSLPLQLTPGNFGALKGIGKYRIFTTPQDQRTIQSDPQFARLAHLVEVEFVPIEVPTGKHKIRKMNECHCLAAREAAKEQAALIYLCADSLLSDNVFDNILSMARKGKRAIVVCSPRLVKEVYCPLYDALPAERKGLPPRDFVKLAMGCLHPLSHSLFWGHARINIHPSHIYWRLDEGNLLGRGFHLHPIFVWPENHQVLPHISIDFDYLAHACPSRELWKVIEDSDEMAVFEASPRSLEEEIRYMRASPFTVMLWASKHTRPLHHFFATKNIFIHSDEKKIEWIKTVQEADKLINRIAVKNNRFVLFFIYFLNFFYRAGRKMIHVCLG